MKFLNNPFIFDMNTEQDQDIIVLDTSVLIYFVIFFLSGNS
jgi:hypothetical protein